MTEKPYYEWYSKLADDNPLYGLNISTRLFNRAQEQGYKNVRGLKVLLERVESGEKIPGIGQHLTNELREIIKDIDNAKAKFATS